MPYMPTGWLAMLVKGFLHRDVSISNTLMLDPPVAMKPFTLPTIEELMARLSIGSENDLGKYVSLLEDVIKKMGFSDDLCHGFIIDGEMAAKSEGYPVLRDAREVYTSISLVAGEHS